MFCRCCTISIKIFKIGMLNAGTQTSTKAHLKQTYRSLLVLFFPCSPQTTTRSACTLRSQRQPVLTLSRSSPKWTLAKVTENKYHIFPLKAIAETRGCWMKCLKCDSLCDERGCFLPLSDQDLYDFIDPNPDEDPALSECDGQQSSHVSCIKVWIYLSKGWL